MKEFSKLFGLAKHIAGTVLKDKSEPNKYDIISEKEKIDIINELSDLKKKEKRHLLIDRIELSKKKDWKTIKSATYNKNNFQHIITVGKVAAIFIVVFGLSYFYYQGGFLKQNESKLIIVENEITIQLSNGKKEVLTNSGLKKIIDNKGKVTGIQEGYKLDYSKTNQGENKKPNTKNGASEKLAFNEINIPYGKTFQLILSDGTKVHLNSGTSLKYPIKFIKGKHREVFLQGEAYFDVAEDKNHPFVVNSNDLNIRVLGTKFDVSSYPEEDQIGTVLISGSVSLYDASKIYQKTNSKLLTPGHLGTWDKKNKNVTFRKVDTSIYTSWIEGKLVFKKTPFKTIRKKLERHYNVTIVNNNLSLDNKVYNAVFETESIEDVLISFQKNYAIDFQIKNNQIIIN